MKELLDEAHDILRTSEDHFTLRRAESYWFAHIKVALDKEHAYLGGSMCSMQDTIDELSESMEDVQDEDDTYDWAAENQDLVARAAARRRSGYDC
jgi:hypothetical protein